jgi:hypothetical protein
MIIIPVCDDIKELISGSSKIAITELYTTRAMLLPTSIVTINWEGFFEKTEIIWDGKTPCFLSISSLNLFADRNAISIPEKNADKINEKNIIVR